jgi:hypothetical protein
MPERICQLADNRRFSQCNGNRDKSQEKRDQSGESICPTPGVTTPSSARPRESGDPGWIPACAGMTAVSSIVNCSFLTRYCHSHPSINPNQLSPPRIRLPLRA